MPQMSQVLRERAVGMLTAGMSTRAVARELNVNFSTISRLQSRFREFGSTSNHYGKGHYISDARLWCSANHNALGQLANQSRLCLLEGGAL